MSSFDEAELKLLDDLTDLASLMWRMRIGNRHRARGWPQHYGFPTPFLDLTSDPAVAVYFAAAPNKNLGRTPRALYRLDLEAVESKVYRMDGSVAPLFAASLMHSDCERAARQSAWVLADQNSNPSFDFQATEHLSDAIEKFIVDGVDAHEFDWPGLLDASSDGFASWPLAVVRGFKAKLNRPLPRRIAEWICDRIPLYEWTPLEVDFDGRGRGHQYRPWSPVLASERRGLNYAADRDEVVKDLCSDRIPIPNGFLFGFLTGGKPGGTVLVERGTTHEVQWKESLPGRFPNQFERVLFE